jgi:uncharacterized protein (TIGR03437 family)
MRLSVAASCLVLGLSFAFAQGPPIVPPGKPSNPGPPSEPPGKPDNPGNPNPGSSTPKAHAFITWLTDRQVVETELKESGKSTLKFKSASDLTNLTVWLTPSLVGLTADPTLFATIKKDTEYSIKLTLENEPAHTLGGTLHLRSDSSNRTFAPPLPINVKVQGSETSSGDSAADVKGVAASTDYRTGAVAPLQIVSLFGEGIGPDQPQSARLDGAGRVATYLGDTQVLFNGIAAPLLMAMRNQVNVVVPSGVATDQTVEIVLTHGSKVSAPVGLPLTSYAPGLFTIGSTGAGQSAALNQDGSVNGALNPARRGSVVSLFGSGFGDLESPAPDGSVAPGASSLRANVTVTIGGVAARVIYAGAAPGLVAGVVQFNVEVPSAISAGDRVPVGVGIGGVSSGSAATIAVQ